MEIPHSRSADFFCFTIIFTSLVYAYIYPLNINEIPYNPNRSVLKNSGEIIDFLNIAGH